jgi:diguanylate cyclase
VNRAPAELARDTLKLLASRREPPTPENYVKAYAETAGIPALVLAPAAAAGAATAATAPADPTDWSQVIGDLLKQLEVRHSGASLTQKRAGLERLLITARRSPQLGDKLLALMRSWGEGSGAVAGSVLVEVASAPAAAPAASVPGATEAAGAAPAIIAGVPTSGDAARPGAPVAAFAVAEGPPSLLPMVDDLAGSLRELVAGVFERELAPRFAALPALARAAALLPPQVRAASTPADCARVEHAIGLIARDVDRARLEQQDTIEEAMALVRMLVANLANLVDDDRWVAGQIELVGRTVAQAPSARVLADAQAQFREAAEHQAALKEGLRELKQTLKSLIAVFVERVGEMSQSAVDYQSRIGRYAEVVRSTDNVESLRGLLDDLMGDIQKMQLDATRSRDDVLGVREQAEQAQAKVVELEAELARVSTALREDALTGALNRRGLDEAIDRETARAQRYGSALCLAVIDLDHFKKLNDSLGHQAGDQALRHLVEVVRPMLRPSDTIGRFGGEEFVLVLPETPRDDAKMVVERLQRELTRRFFLHNNDKVLITFSAGVVQRADGESRDQLVQRADAAMYEAKNQGRNRVVTA